MFKSGNPFWSTAQALNRFQFSGRYSWHGIHHPVGNPRNFFSAVGYKNRFPHLVQHILKFCYLKLRAYVLLCPHSCYGCNAWRCSAWDGHQHYTVISLANKPRTWHCPLASEQHRYPNPCQQHQEFPCSLQSKIQRVPLQVLFGAGRIFYFPN